MDNVRMARDHEKPLEWIGSSHKNLMALPLAVQRLVGYALSLAQSGDQHDAAKVPKRGQRSYAMKTRIVDGIEVQRSSGNVYADLDLPDAEKLKIKTGLVIEIRHAMRRLGLTQQAAAKRMGITQPKVSDMMRGDFTNLSERKLMDCLNRLGYDIEIRVKPATEPVGHLKIALA